MAYKDCKIESIRLQTFKLEVNFIKNMKICPFDDS